MKNFTKKEYLYPEIDVLDMEAKDLLSISNAYDDDVFEPNGLGNQTM